MTAATTYDVTAEQIIADAEAAHVEAIGPRAVTDDNPAPADENVRTAPDEERGNALQMPPPATRQTLLADIAGLRPIPAFRAQCRARSQSPPAASRRRRVEEFDDAPERALDKDPLSRATLQQTNEQERMLSLSLGIKQIGTRPLNRDVILSTDPDLQIALNRRVDNIYNILEIKRQYSIDGGNPMPLAELEKVIYLRAIDLDKLHPALIHAKTRDAVEIRREKDDALSLHDKSPSKHITTLDQWQLAWEHAIGCYTAIYTSLAPSLNRYRIHITKKMGLARNFESLYNYDKARRQHWEHNLGQPLDVEVQEFTTQFIIAPMARGGGDNSHVGTGRGRSASGRETSGELCRNFQRGACTRSSCPHEDNFNEAAARTQTRRVDIRARESRHILNPHPRPPTRHAILYRDPYPKPPYTDDNVQTMHILNEHSIYKTPTPISIAALRHLTLDFPNQPVIHQLIRELMEGFPMQYQGQPGRHLFPNQLYAPSQVAGFASNMAAEIQCGRRTEISPNILDRLLYYQSAPMIAVPKTKFPPLNEEVQWRICANASFPQHLSTNDHVPLNLYKHCDLDRIDRFAAVLVRMRKEGKVVLWKADETDAFRILPQRASDQL
ncbi:hypothetical protein HDU86_001141 [Geranomyces michiganensis]|nr:hypothetical protein HDU86_001141 [Geranomyces michiganensis]